MRGEQELHLEEPCKAKVHRCLAGEGQKRVNWVAGDSEDAVG